MAYTAFIKDGSRFVPFPGSSSGGGGGSVEVKSFVSASRDAVLTAGDPLTVPMYLVGSNSLQLWYDGLLLALGEHYTEASSTSVVFTFDIAADAEIIATVTAVTTSEGASTSVQYDAQRDAEITAGSAYSVPTHTQGSHELLVFLDGCLCVENVVWSDSSSASITFHSTIPKDMEVIVVASVKS